MKRILLWIPLNKYLELSNNILQISNIRQSSKCIQMEVQIHSLNTKFLQLLKAKAEV